MRIAVVAILVALLAVPLAGAETQPTPYPPGYLEASWGEGESPNYDPYIELTWDAPSDTGSAALDGYLVYKVDAEGLQGPFPVDTEKTTYQDWNVGSGGTYAYFVTAVNTDGWESAPSNPVFLSGDYPHCGVFGYTIGPPPDYVLTVSCLLPPPV